jgi:cyd operon protein YbgT
MWYFTWFLGLGLAASVGILNALWYELRTVRQATRDETPPLPTP